MIIKALENISNTSEVKVSSTIEYNNVIYFGRNVIDGKLSGTNADKCGCCWSSANEENPYIVMLLHTVEILVSIEIVGRQDQNKDDMKSNLKGVVVFIDGKRLRASDITYNTNNNTAKMQLSFVPATNITVTRPKSGNSLQWFLFICEVFITEACPYGKFGDDCNSSCHCRKNSSCSWTDGKCPGQCAEGWQGDACDKACDKWNFGLGCNETCHCKEDCDKVTGNCSTGCESGWKGHACNTECDFQHFGNDCENTCNCLNRTGCDHVNGTCKIQECEPGWSLPSCSKACDLQQFGNGCRNSCHCFNNTGCDHVIGNCEIKLCEPGWLLPSCSKACDFQQFGNGCKTTCHCLNDTDCNHVNGTCEINACEPGWSLPSCSKEISSLSLGESNVGAAVGGSIAAFLAIVAVIAGMVLLSRIRNRKSTSHYRQEPFRYLNKAVRQQQSRNQSHSSCSAGSTGNANATYTEIGDFNEDCPDLKEINDEQDVEEANDDNNLQETNDDNDNGKGYYTFANFVGIRIHELWDSIHEKKSNNSERFNEEFKKLPYGLKHPCNVALQTENIGKHKYRNLYAYDHTRVVLEEEHKDGTDYINASYIDGYEKTKKFVASQGPTEQIIDDFWRMVWQLKSNKIVMLTNLLEMGSSKCIQYWPENEECCFGNVNTKLVKVDQDLDYTVRHLECWKDGEKRRRIRQFHFKSWPDKDVPDSTWCLLKFWRVVQTDAPAKAGPIIVHCSAGLGRTGTFIALDNLVHQARTEGCVRPFQVVLSLREQRVNMVQTEEQYVFLHEVLADALLFGTHYIWGKQFEEMYHAMLQKEDGDTRIRLQIQFDLIQESLGRSNEATAAVYTNASAVQSESEEYKPKQKIHGFVQKLDAMFLPNFAGKNTFLLANSPGTGTSKEFWLLVDDSNIKTIVFLAEASSACHKTMRQFQYTAWKDGHDIPGDIRSFIDLLEAVLLWQPHLSESQPILIICSNGCSRSGIVLVAMNELQRLRVEGQINIVESVMMMKKMNSQLINNFEQYKFCHDLMLAYLKHSDVHQNP